MGPPPGASPPMRMTASWSGSERTYRIQVCGAMFRARWRVPLGSLRRHVTGAVRRRSFEEKPVSLFIVPPCAQASRRCENTSDATAASRQAALAFRSLDPLRALREPGRRRRDEERPFPLRTKNCQQNPRTISGSTAQPRGKSPLTGKAPYKSAANLAFGGRSQNCGPAAAPTALTVLAVVIVQGRGDRCSSGTPG
jgi:hypothetical protein